MRFGHGKRRFAIGLALLALAVLPASSQIVAVHPTPPPCTGAHCLRPIPGATVTHHGRGFGGTDRLSARDDL